MGSVYEAEQLDDHLHVAIKVLDSGLVAPTSQAVHRFRREMRAVGAIQSDFIVRTFEGGTDAVTGLPFLVMEYLSGEDLQHVIQRTGPLEPGVALRVATQALQGLAAAHAASIVHRDIKPANIFLARGRDGRIVVKVLDFGIAKIKSDPLLVPHTTGLTTTGGFLGSPLYMSPEQIKSSRDVDHRTDIWSLGSVLYCALAGRAPHQHLASMGQLIYAILTSPPAPLQDVAPWVMPEVAAVVDRSLEINPEQRFASASAMLEALRPHLPAHDSELLEGMLVPLRPDERDRVAPRVQRLVVQPPAAEVDTVAAIRGDETTIIRQDAPSLGTVLRQSEYYDILDALQSAGWNKTEAARRLGMSVRMLARKMKLLGIEKPDFRRGRPRTPRA